MCSHDRRCSHVTESVTHHSTSEKDRTSASHVVTRMCESCHTNVWVMSHECVSHVTRMCESCHTFPYDMSHNTCYISSEKDLKSASHVVTRMCERVTLSHECVSESRCHVNVWASHAFWSDLHIMSLSHDLLRLISHVTYGVAMISWLLQSIFLFCRVSSLLQGCFVETCVSREPSNRSHLISSEKDPTSTNHVVTRMCKPHHRLSYNLFRLIIHATYHPRKFLHPPWRSASHEPARHVVTSVSHATHSHRLCASSLIQSVSSHNTCHVSSKTDPYNCRRILQMTHLRHTSSRKRVSHATHSILHNLLCLILLVVVFQEDILTAYTVTQCNWMKYA